MSDGYWMPLADEARRFGRRVAEQRDAEEHDRAEWIKDVKRRFGLVMMDDCPMSCDPDCEIGTVHCWNWHRPNHKPDWHDPAECDARLLPPATPKWLTLEPGCSYTVISDHTLELPRGWPLDCRCVLLDGEQVSLGGPCPVHC